MTVRSRQSRSAASAASAAKKRLTAWVRVCDSIGVGTRTDADDA